MARDLSVELRRAVVDRLNDPASATGQLLAAERAYGPASPNGPVWPFVRSDLPTVVPAPESCSDVGDYTFRLHGFAKGPDEANVAALGNAMVEDLDGFAVDLDAVPDARLTDTVWTGTQHLRDTAEPDGWHAAISVTCRVDG